MANSDIMTHSEQRIFKKKYFIYRILFPRILSCSSGTGFLPLNVSLTAFM